MPPTKCNQAIHDDYFAMVPVIYRVGNEYHLHLYFRINFNTAIFKFLHNIMPDLPAGIIIIKYPNLQSFFYLSKQYIFNLVTTGIIFPVIIFHMNEMPGCFKRPQHLREFFFPVYQ